MAVFAPMPRARVRIEMSANPGDFLSCRKANRMSPITLCPSRPLESSRKLNRGWARCPPALGVEIQQNSRPAKVLFVQLVSRMFGGGRLVPLEKLHGALVRLCLFSSGEGA